MQGASGSSGRGSCENNSCSHFAISRPIISMNQSTWKMACTSSANSNRLGPGVLALPGPPGVASDIFQNVNADNFSAACPDAPNSCLPLCSFSASFMPVEAGVLLPLAPDWGVPAQAVKCSHISTGTCRWGSQQGWKECRMRAEALYP